MDEWPFQGPGAPPDSELSPVLRLVLPATVVAVREARRRVTDACAGLTAEVVDTAVLITSELFTNAVVHPHHTEHIEPVVGLECHRSPDRVRVGVSDQDPRLPTLRPPGGLAEDGWGLRLLSQLAHRCGVAALPGGRGKTVWFELSVGPDQGSGGSNPAIDAPG